MFTITFLVVVTIFPTFILVLLLRKFNTFDDKEVKLRFGDLYEHLRYDTGGRLVLIEPLFFLLRRSLLIITIVFVRCLAFQYLIFFFAVFV